jgi:hypothetical protein
MSINISQNMSTLLTSVNGGTAPYAFEWNTNNITQNIIPLTNGVYWCLVTDVNGCISDTAFFNVTWITTNTNEISSGILVLSIYPNPSKNIFNISFVSKEEQNLQVRVINVIGEEIYTEDLKQFTGEYSQFINLNEYKKGIYFLQIETSKGVINKKLILQ